MKLTEISKQVRQKVYERDSFDGWPCCIYCGNPHSIEQHHYIERSRGGMGIEENLVCLCSACHRRLHDTEDHELKEFIKGYLSSRYQGWNEENLIIRSKK